MKIWEETIGTIGTLYYKSMKVPIFICYVKNKNPIIITSTLKELKEAHLIIIIDKYNNKVSVKTAEQMHIVGKIDGHTHFINGPIFTSSKIAAAIDIENFLNAFYICGFWLFYLSFMNEKDYEIQKLDNGKRETFIDFSKGKGFLISSPKVKIVY